MHAVRNPTSRPCFSDMSHLCCRIFGHRAAAISGSSCVPLISKILSAQTCGEGVSCIVSFIMYLLFCVREVFSRANHGMLKKQYSPGCHKNGYVSLRQKEDLWSI